MCIRDSARAGADPGEEGGARGRAARRDPQPRRAHERHGDPPARRTRCLLYTSDAADERSSVDLGGRRIIKKNKRKEINRSDILKV